MMEQSLLHEVFPVKSGMVRKGQSVEATEKYFASNAQPPDFDGTVKRQIEMLTKMKAFAGAISKKADGMSCFTLR
ncbi:hypothetical protein [Chitinophaga sp. XS-30]|uniref:hypothetical protein n=1 Tax=Chitinophaga sp. XS-30 TaxID=2604421 RepID=UPI0011DCC996|nr:hypothetical protein [Chitinophaga sp. XS-30]QEH41466.1 hypothetical protein FW415_11460 [Chitinophaga sp. XS-30]